MKIFHHDDMDGRSSAAIVGQIAWKTKLLADNHGIYELTPEEQILLEEYESNSIYVESDYVSKIINPSIIKDGEIVYIVDYSFKENSVNILIDICKRASKVIWIDHHISSKRLLDSGLLDDIENLEAYISMEESGAMLCWKYTNPCPPPKFVQYVSDYDTWKLDDPKTIFFKIGIDMVENGADALIWKKLISDAELPVSNDIHFFPSCILTPSALDEILRNGEIAKKYVDFSNREYFSKFAFETDIFGEKCICVNMKTNSWIFGEAYHKYPLCCVFAFTGERWSYSLYSSNKNIDCSKICSTYGGGGHIGAAGFSTEHCIFNNTNAKIYKNP